MVSLRFWKKKAIELTELEQGIGHSAFASANNQTADRTDQLREEGIDRYLIIDDSLLSFIEDRCQIPVTINGKNFVYTNPQFSALRFLMSHLPSVRWMSREDVEIHKEEIAYQIEELKEQLDEEEYEKWGSVFDAAKPLIESAYDDAVNGNKPMLMKVEKKAFEIGFSKLKEKK